MHYSIFRNSFVFEKWDQFQPKYETINYKENCFLEVEKTGGNQRTINRINSTNPSDYLNTNIYPGQKIKV